jgi:hypothetical protein
MMKKNLWKNMLSQYPTTCANILLNDSNNCKTWWSTLPYIEYELIVPFQL